MNMRLEDKIQVHSIIDEGAVSGVTCLLSVESVESVDEFCSPRTTLSLSGAACLRPPDAILNHKP